jgi:hypothetical protein
MAMSITALLITAIMMALFVSCIAVEIAVAKGGRKALRLGNGIAAGLSFLAGLFFMGGTLSLLSGVVCGAVTWLFASWYGGFIAKQVERQLAMAPEVVKFATANFERLNPDANGEITREGLSRLLDSGTLSAADHRMVTHMNSRLDDIGHLAGQTFVPGAGMGFGTVVDHVACSREDLSTYEQRIRAKYANWR